jgi:hypothetical protein
VKGTDKDEQIQTSANERDSKGTKMNIFGLLLMKGIRKEHILFQMHKLYDLQNKIIIILIIKMFNLDLNRDSIPISKDIMKHLIGKCAIHHII